MTPELARERQALYSRKHDANRNKERDRLRKKRPSPRDPVKVQAKNKVHAALESGRIARPEMCNECGIPGPVQAS